MLNEYVQRIVFSNGRIDIPIQTLRVATGDHLNVSYDEDQNAECILHGMCFGRQSEMSHVSCGGLECVLPIALTLYEYTDISITRVQKLDPLGEIH